MATVVALALFCAGCTVICYRSIVTLINSPSSATPRVRLSRVPYVVLVAAAAVHFAAAFLVTGTVEVDVAYQSKAADQFLAGDRRAVNSVAMPDSQDLSQSSVGWLTLHAPAMYGAVLALRAVGLPWPFVIPVLNLICFLGAATGIVAVAKRLGLSVQMRIVLAGVLAATPFYPFHILGTSEVFVIALIPWGVSLALDALARERDAAVGPRWRWWWGLGLLVGALYWVKYSALIIGLALGLFAVGHLTWATVRRRQIVSGACGLLVFGLSLGLPVGALMTINHKMSGTTAEQGFQLGSEYDGPRYVVWQGHHFGSSARGPFPLLCFAGSFATETELGRSLFEMGANVILSQTSVARLIEDSWHWPARLTVKTLLGIPFSGILVWLLIRGFYRLDWPVKALVFTIGVVPNVLHVFSTWTLGYNSFGWAANYLASVRFVFYLGLLLVLQHDSIRQRGNASRTRLSLSAPVIVAVVFTILLPFGNGLLRVMEVVVFAREHYVDNMREINNAVYSRRNPLDVKRDLRSVLTDKNDVVFLYGLTPSALLDFTHRASYESSFLASDPSFAEPFAPTSFTTSHPLRVLVVVNKTLAAKTGRVMTIKNQFPQAVNWHPIPLPPDSLVEGWFTDLRPTAGQ